MVTAAVRLDVAAFGESGKPLSTPGPVIRVPLGTEIRATVRNRLDRPLTVYGFGKVQGQPDSVTIPVNGTAPLQLKATAPGTYYYYAKRGVDPIWPPARRGHAAPRRHRRGPAGRAAEAGRPHLRDLLVVRGGAVEPVGIEPVHHGDQWALLAAHGAA